MVLSMLTVEMVMVMVMVDSQAQFLLGLKQYNL